MKKTKKILFKCIEEQFSFRPIDFVNVHLFHDDSNIALVHEVRIMNSLFSNQHRNTANGIKNYK